jgi:hypothetical protein
VRLAAAVAFISLERAVERRDELIGARRPGARLAGHFVGAGGITWLHRWARMNGRRGGFFAGEPTVPKWIEPAALPPDEG